MTNAKCETASALIGLLEEFTKIDFLNAPFTTFFGSLRKSLVQTHRFDSKDAEAICGAFKFNVPDGRMTKEELTRAGELFAEVCASLRDALWSVGIQDPVKIISKSDSLYLKFD